MNHSTQPLDKLLSAAALATPHAPALVGGPERALTAWRWERRRLQAQAWEKRARWALAFSGAIAVAAVAAAWRFSGSDPADEVGPEKNALIEVVWQ